jgi:hypothetical protein
MAVKSARPALDFPTIPNRPEDVADWLELNALFSRDLNSSAGDIERELDRLSVGDPESLLGNVFLEIDRRQKAMDGNAYPFKRAVTSIEISEDSGKFATYFFCLGLSYFGWKLRKDAPCNPWLLFETISAHSAADYLQGDVLVFGTSTRSGKKSKNTFADKVTELATLVGEGEGFREQRTFSTKDSKIDLIAWKRFPDQRSSQLILFGQCAAGANWYGDKLSSLDPEAFWGQWMKKSQVSAFMKSVFIPHRVFDDGEWELRARPAKLLFDRCRVVNHAHHRITKALRKQLLNCCRSEWKLPL